MRHIEQVVTETLVNLVRQVPWGPSRAELMATSRKLSGEASFERGWDNYSTAANLSWEASMHQLAAEARFPREGDGQLRRFKNEIISALEDLVHGREDDCDVGELSLRFKQGFVYAMPDLTDIELDNLTDELAAMGRVDDPEYRKSSRRDQRFVMEMEIVSPRL